MKLNHAPSTFFTAIIFGCALVLLLLKGVDLFKTQFQKNIEPQVQQAGEQRGPDYVLIPANNDKQEAQGLAPHAFSSDRASKKFQSESLKIRQ